MSWQDKVLADVRAAGTAHKRTGTVFGRDLKPLQFACTLQFLHYVMAAAEAMAANRSTYVRRVLAVHAAHVLGVPVRTILWESPDPKVWGYHPVAPQLRTKERDDGEGIEGWCPHPGCTGEHLKPGLR